MKIRRTPVPKVGVRIRLLTMPDDPDPVPFGSMGTVTGGSVIHDWTQINVAWDDGRTLSLSVPPDTFEVVS